MSSSLKLRNAGRLDEMDTPGNSLSNLVNAIFASSERSGIPNEAIFAHAAVGRETGIVSARLIGQTQRQFEVRRIVAGDTMVPSPIPSA